MRQQIPFEYSLALNQSQGMEDGAAQDDLFDECRIDQRLLAEIQAQMVSDLKTFSSTKGHSGKGPDNIDREQALHKLSGSYFALNNPIVTKIRKSGIPTVLLSKCRAISFVMVLSLGIPIIVVTENEYQFKECECKFAITDMITGYKWHALKDSLGQIQDMGEIEFEFYSGLNTRCRHDAFVSFNAFMHSKPEEFENSVRIVKLALAVTGTSPPVLKKALAKLAQRSCPFCVVPTID